MLIEGSQWPKYASTYEALVAETASWGDRLEQANAHYNDLEGELPSVLGGLAIGIVDGNESPEEFSMLNVYEQQRIDPRKFGALLLLNFEGSIVPAQAQELLQVIHAQREKTSIPTAVAVVGYNGKRRFDHIRRTAWDIAVVHALRNKIEGPVVGISNDADMTAASPDFLQNMIYNQYVGTPAVWGSEVRFAQPGGAELPVNRLISYMNFGRGLAGQLKGTPIMFGGSMACTLDTYAISGGWVGAHTAPNHYGTREPSRLVLNVWERLTGETGSMEELVPAYQRCAQRVMGWAEVSPRREIYALSINPANPEEMVTVLTTAPGKSYRSLTKKEIGALAKRIPSVEHPDALAYIEKLHDTWFAVVPEEKHDELSRGLQKFREDLALPVVISP